MPFLNVLITGAASGIGYAAAKYFAQNGCNVYALDVKPTPPTLNVTSFVQDVCDEAGLSKVKEALDASHVTLDTIICAAGIHEMESVVEAQSSNMKHLLDINLFGPMFVNRVFHPLLKSNGRVIIVTSEVATYSPMPFNGLYNISKTALECYADTLRQELNLLGQRVITIRPGAVKTPLESKAIDKTRALEEKTELYKKQASHFSKLAAKFASSPINAGKIAKIIYKAATANRTRYSYSKNRSAGLVLLNLLPKRMQCFIIKLLLNMK